MNDIALSTSINTNEMKPCPFCGQSVALISDIETRKFIFSHLNFSSCAFCNFEIPWEYAISLNQAIELWNTRRL